MNPTNWKWETMEHIKQIDSYNCGVYIIYYFSKIVKNQPLTDNIDIDIFRKNLKCLILHKSDDMKSRCFFCSGECFQDNQIFQCMSCKRSIHEKCLRTVKEIKQGITVDYKITNGICDLCRLN